jgi:hypothetical protein
MAPDVLAEQLKAAGFRIKQRVLGEDGWTAQVVQMHTAMTADAPCTNVMLITEEFLDREFRVVAAERDALRLRAEKAEAERDAPRMRAEKAEAELAALTAERKAEHKDRLQRAILSIAETMSTMWPKGEVPSSRLWQGLSSIAVTWL